MDGISNLQLIVGFIILYYIHGYVKKVTLPVMGLVYVAVFYLVVKYVLK